MTLRKTIIKVTESRNACLPGLVPSIDPSVQAGALLRVARVERNQNHVDNAFLQKWTQQAMEAGRQKDAHISLLTDSGGVFPGEKVLPGPQTVMRNLAETGLAWTLALTANGSGESSDFAARGNLLALGRTGRKLLPSGGCGSPWSCALEPAR